MGAPVSVFPYSQLSPYVASNLCYRLVTECLHFFQSLDSTTFSTKPQQALAPHYASSVGYRCLQEALPQPEELGPPPYLCGRLVGLQKHKITGPTLTHDMKIFNERWAESQPCPCISMSHLWSHPCPRLGHQKVFLMRAATSTRISPIFLCQLAMSLDTVHHSSPCRGSAFSQRFLTSSCCSSVPCCSSNL